MTAFPVTITAGRKTPACPHWPTYSGPAPAADQVAGYPLPPGELVMVDVDDHGKQDAVSGWERVHLLDLPATPLVYETQSRRGKHFGYRWSGDPVEFEPLGPGVEIQALASTPGTHGRWVCVPAEARPVFEHWAANIHDLPWAPAAVYKSTANALVAGYRRNDAKRWHWSTNGDDPITSGYRHYALKSFAGRLRAMGLAGDALVEALYAFNLDRCQPPRSLHDIERIAAWFQDKDEVAWMVEAEEFARTVADRSRA